jgi:Ca2+-binding EF-hand superfamily protein
MGIPQQQLQDFFNILDTDHDGKVSADELFGFAPLRPLLEGLTEGEISQTVVKNGSISFEELKQSVEKAGNLD